MHHEADKNSMNSCQLIPTHSMTNIKLKRIEQMNGYGMNNEWQTGRIKILRSQSSRKKLGY